MPRLCPQCGGRFSYPGLFGCKDPVHAHPTQAQQVVWAIEAELGNRRGVGWSGVDEEMAYEIRGALTRIVESFMAIKI